MQNIWINANHVIVFVTKNWSTNDICYCYCFCINWSTNYITLSVTLTGAQVILLFCCIHSRTNCIVYNSFCYMNRSINYITVSDTYTGATMILLFRCNQSKTNYITLSVTLTHDELFFFCFIAFMSQQMFRTVEGVQIRCQKNISIIFRGTLSLKMFILANHF